MQFGIGLLSGTIRQSCQCLPIINYLYIMVHDTFPLYDNILMFHYHIVIDHCMISYYRAIVMVNCLLQWPVKFLGVPFQLLSTC